MPVVLRKLTANVERAVPILAPIIAQSAISKLIMPLDNAVSVITLAPVLVCRTRVIMIPMRILCRSQILAQKVKLCDKTSTLSFIYPSHKKSNPNHNKNFDRRSIFLLLEPMTSKIPPSAITGSVMASIFILKPISQINHGVSVVPILAQRMIPIPCWRLSNPAHTNHSIIIVTTVLLCKIAVANVPIPIV